MKNFEIDSISPETFREIFQSAAEGILMIDQSGTILLANPVSEAMFGYEQGELVAMSVDDLIPNRFRGNHAHNREQFHQHPEPRRMGIGRDLMAKRKDNSEFPVEVSLSYRKINERVLIMAFVIDISQRKKSEEALKQSEEQLLVYAAELEKKVKVRTEALNNTIKELEREIKVRKKAEEETRNALAKERELNELKSKFVSIASHEFRTPLSTILSSASLISQYKEKGENEKVDKHIGRIKSNVNHLTGILNDFLSLGKLEEGKVDIVKENITLTDFFRDIIEEIKHLLKPGQYVEVTSGSTVDTFCSDPRILRNILFNLLSNASKYSDQGKKIFIECATENDQLYITVRDEGIGIPEDDKRHMFERFFRASNATNIQGTGLGLNIIKRYLDLLNGSITFDSEYGKGSTFTVMFPLNP